MKEIIFDTLLDAIKILPFLLITYLIMEYIEHRTSDKLEVVIQKSGRFGPLLGSLLGVFPQCGFSAAAANLYAGRIITLGTLISIFLSTSDEMLPILISEQVELSIIIKIIGIKIIIGMIAGFFIDVVIKKKKGSKKEELRITHMCEHEHCNCGESKESIIKSAVTHTMKILFFIIIITFVMNFGISLLGEEALVGLIQNRKILGPVVAGLVGLIPNCAASIIITQLYLEGMLGLGSMMSGLLTGAGIGLLVLFKVNDNMKENGKIVLLMYVIGVVSGSIMELSGLAI